MLYRFSEADAAAAKRKMGRRVMRWISRSQKQDWIRLAALTEVVLRTPECDPVALRRLCAGLINDRRRAQETVAIVSRVAERLPWDADVRLTLARSLMAINDIAAAGREMNSAVALAPDNPRVRVQSFSFLVQTEQWEAATALRDAIAAIAPMHPSLFDLRMRSNLPDTEREAQLAVCEAALKGDPTLTDGIYFKAITLARLGRSEEARALLNPDRYLKIGALTTPSGFGGEEAFRAGLVDEIRRHPDLTEDGHEARGRRQTLQLRHLEETHIAALLEQIGAAVDDYERNLPEDGGAFVAHRPRQAKLAAWAIIYDSDGHQLAHRHTDGWVSGVYYVTAPRAKGETTYRGPLVVGEAPSRYGLDPPPWSVREIEPRPGRIVLFPSYVPHATKPSEVDGERICVAFDVVPVR